VATQDPELVKGLVVEDKAQRVARYHEETVRSFFEVLGAAGLRHPRELKPWYIMKRSSTGEVRSYHDLYPPIEAGALLNGAGSLTGGLAHAWREARADRF
jgi:hypothetical protein